MINEGESHKKQRLMQTPYTGAEAVSKLLKNFGQISEAVSRFGNTLNAIHIAAENIEHEFRNLASMMSMTRYSMSMSNNSPMYGAGAKRTNFPSPQERLIEFEVVERAKNDIRDQLKQERGEQPFKDNATRLDEYESFLEAKEGAYKTHKDKMDGLYKRDGKEPVTTETKINEYQKFLDEKFQRLQTYLKKEVDLHASIQQARGINKVAIQKVIFDYEEHHKAQNRQSKIKNNISGSDYVSGSAPDYSEMPEVPKKKAAIVVLDFETAGAPGADIQKDKNDYVQSADIIQIAAEFRDDFGNVLETFNVFLDKRSNDISLPSKQQLGGDKFAGLQKAWQEAKDNGSMVTMEDAAAKLKSIIDSIVVPGVTKFVVKDTFDTEIVQNNNTDKNKLLQPVLGPLMQNSDVIDVQDVFKQLFEKEKGTDPSKQSVTQRAMAEVDSTSGGTNYDKQVFTIETMFKALKKPLEDLANELKESSTDLGDFHNALGDVRIESLLYLFAQRKLKIIAKEAAAKNLNPAKGSKGNTASSTNTAPKKPNTTYSSKGGVQKVEVVAPLPLPVIIVGGGGNLGSGGGLPTFTVPLIDMDKFTAQSMQAMAKERENQAAAKAGGKPASSGKPPAPNDNFVTDNIVDQIINGTKPSDPSKTRTGPTLSQPIGPATSYSPIKDPDFVPSAGTPKTEQQVKDEEAYERQNRSTSSFIDPNTKPITVDPNQPLVESFKPTVTPTPPPPVAQPPVATAFSASNKSTGNNFIDVMKEDDQTVFQLIQKNNPNLLEKIKDLHADKKTAKQISQNTGQDEELIRSLRRAMNLPAFTGKAGMGVKADTEFTQEDVDKFENWKASYLKSKSVASSNSPKQTVKSFAENFTKGIKQDSPEDLEFYANNKDEVEKELNRLKNNTTPPAPAKEILPVSEPTPPPKPEAPLSKLDKLRAAQKDVPTPEPVAPPKPKAKPAPVTEANKEEGYYAGKHGIEFGFENQSSAQATSSDFINNFIQGIPKLRNNSVVQPPPVLSDSMQDMMKALQELMLPVLNKAQLNTTAEKPGAEGTTAFDNLNDSAQKLVSKFQKMFGLDLTKISNFSASIFGPEATKNKDSENNAAPFTGKNLAQGSFNRLSGAIKINQDANEKGNVLDNSFGTLLHESIHAMFNQLRKQTKIPKLGMIENIDISKISGGNKEELKAIEEMYLSLVARAKTAFIESLAIQNYGDATPANIKNATKDLEGMEYFKEPEEIIATMIGDTFKRKDKEETRYSRKNKSWMSRKGTRKKNEVENTSTFSKGFNAVKNFFGFGGNNEAKEMFDEGDQTDNNSSNEISKEDEIKSLQAKVNETEKTLDNVQDEFNKKQLRDPNVQKAIKNYNKISRELRRDDEVYEEYKDPKVQQDYEERLHKADELISKANIDFSNSEEGIDLKVARSKAEQAKSNLNKAKQTNFSQMSPRRDKGKTASTTKPKPKKSPPNKLSKAATIFKGAIKALLNPKNNNQTEASIALLMPTIGIISAVAAIVADSHPGAVLGVGSLGAAAGLIPAMRASIAYDLKRINSKLKPIFKSTITKIGKFGSGIKNKSVGLGSSIKSGGKSTLKIGSTLLSSLGSGLKETANIFSSGIKEEISNSPLIKGASFFAKGTIGGIKESSKLMFTGGKEEFANIYQSVKNSSAVKKIGAFAKGAKTLVKGAISGVQESSSMMYSGAKEEVGNLYSGIKNSTVAKTITNLLSSAVEGVKDSSTLMFSGGKEEFLNWGKGIKNIGSKVSSLIKGSLNTNKKGGMYSQIWKTGGVKRPKVAIKGTTPVEDNFKDAQGPVEAPQTADSFFGELDDLARTSEKADEMDRDAQERRRNQSTNRRRGTSSPFTMPGIVGDLVEAQKQKQLEDDQKAEALRLADAESVLYDPASPSIANVGGNVETPFLEKDKNKPNALLSNQRSEIFKRDVSSASSEQLQADLDQIADLLQGPAKNSPLFLKMARVQQTKINDQLNRLDAIKKGVMGPFESKEQEEDVYNQLQFEREYKNLEQPTPAPAKALTATELIAKKKAELKAPEEPKKEDEKLLEKKDPQQAPGKRERGENISLMEALSQSFDRLTGKAYTKGYDPHETFDKRADGVAGVVSGAKDKASNLLDNFSGVPDIIKGALNSDIKIPFLPKEQTEEQRLNGGKTYSYTGYTTDEKGKKTETQGEISANSWTEAVQKLNEQGAIFVEKIAEVNGGMEGFIKNSLRPDAAVSEQNSSTVQYLDFLRDKLNTNEMNNSNTDGSLTDQGILESNKLLQEIVNTLIAIRGEKLEPAPQKMDAETEEIVNNRNLDNASQGAYSRETSQVAGDIISGGAGNKDTTKPIPFKIDTDNFPTLPQNLDINSPSEPYANLPFPNQPIIPFDSNDPDSNQAPKNAAPQSAEMGALLSGYQQEFPTSSLPVKNPQADASKGIPQGAIDPQNIITPNATEPIRSSFSPLDLGALIDPKAKPDLPPSDTAGESSGSKDVTVSGSVPIDVNVLNIGDIKPSPAPSSDSSSDATRSADKGPKPSYLVEGGIIGNGVSGFIKKSLGTNKSFGTDQDQGPKGKDKFPAYLAENEAVLPEDAVKNNKNIVRDLLKGKKIKYMKKGGMGGGGSAPTATTSSSGSAPKFDPRVLTPKGDIFGPIKQWVGDFSNNTRIGFIGKSVMDFGKALQGTLNGLAGFVKAASPDAFSTLTGSIQLLMGAIGVQFIPIILRVSAILQSWYQDILMGEGVLGEFVAKVAGWINEMPEDMLEGLVGIGLVVAGIVALAPVFAGLMAVVGIVAGAFSLLMTAVGFVASGFITLVTFLGTAFAGVATAVGIGMAPLAIFALGVLAVVEMLSGVRGPITRMGEAIGNFAVGVARKLGILGKDHSERNDRSGKEEREEAKKIAQAYDNPTQAKEALQKEATSERENFTALEKESAEARKNPSSVKRTKTVGTGDKARQVKMTADDIDLEIDASRRRHNALETQGVIEQQKEKELKKEAPKDKDGKPIAEDKSKKLKDLQDKADAMLNAPKAGEGGVLGIKLPDMSSITTGFDALGGKLKDAVSGLLTSGPNGKGKDEEYDRGSGLDKGLEKGKINDKEYEKQKAAQERRTTRIGTKDEAADDKENSLKFGKFNTKYTKQKEDEGNRKKEGEQKTLAMSFSKEKAQASFSSVDEAYKKIQVSALGDDPMTAEMKKLNEVGMVALLQAMNRGQAGDKQNADKIVAGGGLAK